MPVPEAQGLQATWVEWGEGGVKWGGGELDMEGVGCCQAGNVQSPACIPRQLSLACEFVFYDYCNK